MLSSPPRCRKTPGRPPPGKCRGRPAPRRRGGQAEPRHLYAERGFFRFRRRPPRRLYLRNISYFLLISCKRERQQDILREYAALGAGAYRAVVALYYPFHAPYAEAVTSGVRLCGAEPSVFVRKLAGKGVFYVYREHFRNARHIHLDIAPLSAFRSRLTGVAFFRFH